MNITYRLRAAVGAGSLLVLGLAACGGGGSSSPSPIPTPTIAATSKPTAAPSATPSPTPTATTGALGKHIAAAPEQVYTTKGVGLPQAVRRLAGTRRTAANSLPDSIPTVIGSFSPYWGQTLSEFLVWVLDANDNIVTEASANASITTPDTISSVGLDTAPAFASQYHDWIVQANSVQSGKATVTVTFGDGTTGTLPDYVYDGFYHTCSTGPTDVNGVSQSPGWSYSSGVPTPTSTANADVYIDCTAGTLNFPHQAFAQYQPVADAWGNVETQMTSVMSANTTTSAVASVSLANIQPGEIFIVTTSTAGVYEKVMPLTITSSGSYAVFGISQESNASGAFAF